MHYAGLELKSIWEAISTFNYLNNLQGALFIHLVTGTVTNIAVEIFKKCEMFLNKMQI